MPRRNLLPYAVFLPVVAVLAIGWWRSDSGRREALDRLSRLESAAARVQPAPQPVAPSVPDETEPEKGKPTVTPRPSKNSGSSPSSGSDTRTIDDLHQRIQELSREVAAAREETAKAEAKLASEAAETKRIQAQLDELREATQAQRRSNEAIEAELRVKSERLTRIEAAEKAASERAAKAEASSVKVAAQNKELDDLIRRRETLATSLLRRYRDVTDLYRNFTLNAQNREAPGAGLQAGDLSRIQSAIQQAEEDLRQLNSINGRVAQAARAK